MKRLRKIIHSNCTLLGAVFCVLVLVSILAIIWVFPGDTQHGINRPQHRISRAQFERIRMGMTLDQVESLLGVPSGYYGPGKTPPLWTVWENEGVIGIGESVKPWQTEQIKITVWFGHDNKVISKQLLRRLD